jgi:transposase
MMGRRNQDQGQLFYEFRLEGAVAEDHLVRKIKVLLDLSWVYTELAPYYSEIGRPSIDPELMIRMLIICYVFAIRSERQICREARVNLAYRWFCDLGLEDAIPDHSAFSRARNERFRQSDIFRRVFERVVGADAVEGPNCFDLDFLPDRHNLAAGHGHAIGPQTARATIIVGVARIG